MKKIKTIFTVLLVLSSQALWSVDRWQIQDNGAIRWVIDDNIPHFDHIEMSGLEVSTVLRYGVNQDGSFGLERSMVWPMLRTIPNNTHASMKQRFAIDFPSFLIVNGLTLSNEKVQYMELDGKLTVVSTFGTGINISSRANNEPVPVVELSRTFFPSTDKPMLCERYTVRNITDKNITVNIPSQHSVYHTDPQKGVDGAYTMIASIQTDKNQLLTLAPDDSFTFYAAIQAYKKGQQEIKANIADEEKARNTFINEIWTKLKFNSPDSTLNTAFAFAKIRASESIYSTSGGLMHGPGGESYYAAIWANDQAEYANPFFPFLGYQIGNQSALNSFKHFARFMNDEYEPIPSSIIAEGKDIWNGAGDRGDGAMIAYGATRYALAMADKREALELWPLIEWCLEYCRRKLNDDGVVISDSDELEGRFPAGDANLCTSSLYYDALISASYLAREIGIPTAISKSYAKQAKVLKYNINKHFGATIEGFETYQYYEGNDILRSWIAIPLTVGIFDRKEGTVDALFSPRLWTDDGLLTQAGTETFWDRSTLYALRGVFASGAREKAMEYMNKYSQQRLLGNHVPYPIEAWPEGNQRHLSAESALYCRIVTEGIFGIRPIGFNTFVMTPQLPNDWDNMELNNIQAFSNHPFDIKVMRNREKIKTQIIQNNKVLKTFNTAVGEEIKVTL